MLVCSPLCTAALVFVAFASLSTFVTAKKSTAATGKPVKLTREQVARRNLFLHPTPVKKRAAASPAHAPAVVRGVKTAKTRKVEYKMVLPDVTTCHDGERYIINHILFFCMHRNNGQQRMIVPMACFDKNDPKGTQINIGARFKEPLFLYRCDKVNASVVYRPISCLYSSIEIPPGATIKSGKHEFTCTQHPLGFMTLVIRNYLHNLCSLGGRNETLSAEGKCPGMSANIRHSEYGSGTIVRYDVRQQILLA